MKLSTFAGGLRETAEVCGTDQKALKARLLSGATAIEMLSKALNLVLPLARTQAPIADAANGTGVPELLGKINQDCVVYAQEILECYGDPTENPEIPGDTHVRNPD